MNDLDQQLTALRQERDNLDAKLRAVKAALSCEAGQDAETVARRYFHENKELRRKADECWGAANYRLKYLDVIGTELGRPYIDGEGDAPYTSECAELARVMRADYQDALKRVAVLSSDLVDARFEATGWQEKAEDYRRRLDEMTQRHTT